MKLCHLHLINFLGNRKTLICNLIDGSIQYVLYDSHSSNGCRNSLSNLQCNLPIDKASKKETKEQFKKRIIKTINEDSTYYVANQVSTNITF